MLTGDIINAIIAALAFISLALSFWFNRKTLRQTKELNDKALVETKALYEKSINAQLFDKRYEVIEYFRDIFRGDYKKPDNYDSHKFHMYYWRMDNLFVNTKDFKEACFALNRFYSGKPLPDFTSKVKLPDDLSNNIELAFTNYYLAGISQLDSELGIKDK